MVSIRDNYNGPARAWIRITRRFQQRLGEITPEDVQKEGFGSFDEFKCEWTNIYGEWNPDQIVTVYEFRLIDGNEIKRDGDR